MRVPCLRSITKSVGLLGMLLLVGRPLTPQEAVVKPVFNIYNYIYGNKLENFPEAGEHFKATDDAAPADIAKNTCREQPDFGTKICKDVDVADFSPATVARPPYSRWATDNSDGTLYYVTKNAETPVKSGRGQMAILRTQDNSVYSIPNLNGLESSEFRWDSTGDHPYRLYYRSNCTLRQYDADTRHDTLIRDFSGWVKDTFGETCGKIFNDVEGDSSPDNRYWAFMVTKVYQYNTFPLLGVIVYDKNEDKIIGVLDRRKFLDQGGSDKSWESYGYRPNMVDIAPSGDRVLLLWPCARYPIDDSFSVPLKATLSSGLLTVSSTSPTDNFSAGSRVVLAASGSAAALAGTWGVVSVADRHTLVLDVSAAGLPNGSYMVSSFRPALVSITAQGGTVTITTSIPHQLAENVIITLVGTPVAALNKTFRVANVVLPTVFTIKAAVDDNTYTDGGMYMRDSRYGVCIGDSNLSFPTEKGSTSAASDGPHVYNFDFSNPVKVCNTETHGGWAWALNGDPVYVCQVNNTNWAQAEADTVGFTNIYTGVYTPIFSHSDMNYQGGFHFGRFYNRDIRGWAAVKIISSVSDTNKLRDTLCMVELKHYNDQPRIWRVGQLFNNHVGYDTEGHGPLTRDGLLFRFGGNWNAVKSSSPVNTYTLQLPDNWWSILNADTASTVLVRRSNATAASPRTVPRASQRNITTTRKQRE
jgi:hypothetical protein